MLVLNSETISRMNITPPHLQHSHGENSPQLSGLPVSVDRATRLGEVPHFTCERDQEIKRDSMERVVTPPRRGTSPSRGPPPPCEQALKQKILCHGVLFALKNDPKGSFTTREMPKDKTSEKCRLQNLVAFSKNPGITPCKKVDFLTQAKYALKNF